jgi:hypothetical protein
VWTSVYGQHEATWLAFYDFFRQVCDLSEITTPLLGLTEAAQSTGWFWPFRNAVILTERHTTVHLDEQGRIHCEYGPAIAYPDGWSIYAIHGLRLPERVIMQPETITVREIEYEQNVEIRRVMIERYGQSRYLLDSGVQLMHEDGYGQGGQFDT